MYFSTRLQLYPTISIDVFFVMKKCQKLFIEPQIPGYKRYIAMRICYETSPYCFYVFSKTGLKIRIFVIFEVYSK